MEQTNKKTAYERTKEWRKTHPQEYMEQQRRYRERYVDKIREYKKNYYLSKKNEPHSSNQEQVT
jgi:hypothetical protein